MQQTNLSSKDFKSEPMSIEVVHHHGKENGAWVPRCYHDRSQTAALLHGEASVASGFGDEGFEVGGHGCDFGSIRSVNPTRYGCVLS